MFGLKKIVGPKKKFWSEKNCWSKIVFGPKKIGPTKSFGQKKISGLKFLFWSNKNFKSKINFVKKNCWSKKKFDCKIQLTHNLVVPEIF